LRFALLHRPLVIKLTQIGVGGDRSEGAGATLIFAERGIAGNHLASLWRAKPPTVITVGDGLWTVPPDASKALKRDGAGEVVRGVGETGILILYGGCSDGDDRGNPADQEDGAEEYDGESILVVEEAAFDRKAEMF